MATRSSARRDTGAHTRSFTGCGTCRSRHVKCDEGRPTCSMCAYFDLPCAGYKKDVFFDTKNPDSRIRFRRPLLTEEERQRMSQWLVATAPPKSTTKLLSRIDEEGERHASSSEDIGLVFGPFGVFKVQQRQDECSSPGESLPLQVVEELESEDTSTSSPPQDISQILETLPMASNFAQWSPEFMQSLLEQPEQGLTPTTPDLLEMIMDQGHLATPSITMPPPDYQLTTFVPTTYSPVSPLTSPSITKSIPQDAVFLLKHYSSTVISLMTPVRHKKTPWHILFIPHVKDSLAALALGEDLSHASLCTFFGTLAISAFSLGGVSQSETWLDQAQTYLQRAHEHARSMLITAYDIPKPAKYKSILMAILTMVQVSNFSGNRHQAEEYFLEAEKFIRLRGLKRKKSRKVRLLHHCYVFERMFHESIFICGANSIQRRHVRRAIESSGLSRCSVDGLSFRLYKWQNLQQEMLRVRDREEGENDLHLERPGLFSATLYPEIFGVPEPWILLLSLVIRLGVEKDGAEQDPDSSGLNLKDYISRAKALEDYINQLQRPSEMAISSATQQSSIDRHILENMLEAMRHALAIYFYRRIYNLNASMLQEKVVKVRDCLLQCQCADSSVVHGSASFIWPAFIAACEAEDPEVQKSFATWFETSARRSGLSCFSQTLGSVEKIWEEKCHAYGKSVTWLDLMRRTGSQQQGLVF